MAFNEFTSETGASSHMSMHITCQSILTHKTIHGTINTMTPQNLECKLWIGTLQFQFGIVELMTMEGLSFWYDNVIIRCPSNDIT